MRVLCVNSDFNNLKSKDREQIVQFPAAMEEYTVEQQMMINGKSGYVIAELEKFATNGELIVFDARRFVLYENQEEWYYEEEEMQEGFFTEE